MLTTGKNILGASVLALVVAGARADSRALIDFAAADAAARLKPDFHCESQVATRLVDLDGGKALEIAIQPGEAGFPGLRILPPGAAWDLSACGHVEARVFNPGSRPVTVNLRVDNAGDWRQAPWNAESAVIAAGATGTVKVIFGYAYGLKPGFALNPAAVVNVLFFVARGTEARTLRLDALLAAGPAGEQPPVDPKSVRVAPAGGAILARGATQVPPHLLETRNGAQARVDDGALLLELPAGRQPAAVALKPATGRWDLRAGSQVRVKLRNSGAAAASPRIRLESNGGPTESVAGAPLAPGAQAELVVPFTPSVTWRGIENSVKTEWNATPGTGTRFVSDAVSAVIFGADTAATLSVEAVVSEAPVAAVPAWVGQRPPVEGEWTKTFDETFDGTTVDLTKWNIYTANYWDRRSHFSRDNVIVRDGLARLRFERRPGPHNDVPTNAVTTYATGFLDTYGKWVQRYGYFEARMKLPAAPGLWPGFWLMPDRGLATGPQWKRADTGAGGMEFDIMEYLSRWGAHRYNIAMHWDGYGKGHQQTGTSCVYCEPDAEGFVTCGLLWTPGSAIYYCNGREVARWESPRVSSVPSNLIFTHVSGGWDNDALDDRKLPCDFVIDYVRCWQRKDLASAADGVRSTAATPAAPTQ
jgi:beta-glucanase (GH16 family)